MKPSPGIPHANPSHGTRVPQFSWRRGVRAAYEHPVPPSAGSSSCRATLSSLAPRGPMPHGTRVPGIMTNLDASQTGILRWVRPLTYPGDLRRDAR